MKSLVKYIGKYKKEAVAAPFLKLAEALLELCIPLFVANIIDAGTGPSAKRVILLNCLYMALFGLAGMLFSVFSQYLSSRAAVGFSTGLRADVFRRVLELPVPDADSFGNSRILARLTSDIDRIQNGVNLGLRLLLRSPFIVFGSVIMASVRDPKSSVIFIAAVPVLAAVVFAVMLIGNPLQKKAGEKVETLTVRTSDNITGVRVIRAFSAEKRQNEAFSSENEAASRAVILAGRVTSLLNPLTFVIVNFAVILIIRSGAAGVDSGRISQGTVVALYNYMAQILTELVKLASLIITLTRTSASADRVREIIELSDSIRPEAKETSGSSSEADRQYAVEFEDVSFRYPGASGDALSSVSFRLPAGGSLGVIGGTGSGKSTLALLVPGIYRQTSGRIRVFGEEYGPGNAGRIRKRIGFVPQKAKLFCGSVAENVSWGGAADGGDIDAALRTASAYGFVASKPGGKDTAVERDGSNFSGGQRQRLTIARALSGNPDLLVLDDSFSALDYKTDLEVRRGIASAGGRPARIIITQRPSSVMDCDAILVLDNGSCAGYGTHAELMETCPLYREIYASQYGGDALL